jgi:Flp pilus assembly protein CpaB
VEFAQKLISTRAGTIAVASGAALLAGVFILVYVNRYRHSIKAQGAPVTVLVAKRLIPKGTSGAAALQEGLFTRDTSIRGLVATTDVYAGQQLSASDFTAGAKSLATTLSGSQRVLDVPLDNAHGMIGHVQVGDRVDVMVGFNVQASGGGTGYAVNKLLAQNVMVADVAEQSGGVATSTSNTTVSLRVTNRQAEEIAYAADNGKVWLVLRPPTGAKQARQGLVNAGTILLGVPPITLPSYSGDVNRAIRNAIKRALTTSGGGR